MGSMPSTPDAVSNAPEVLIIRYENIYVFAAKNTAKQINHSVSRCF